MNEKDQLARRTIRKILRDPIRALASSVVVAYATFLSTSAYAQIAPVTTCDRAGIGSVALTRDGPPVTIESVSMGTVGTGTAAVPYCLVKVLVPQVIHIWVSLPTGDHWNGRFRSEGGGGYAGTVGVANDSVLNGYVGAMTDTGHTLGSGTFGCKNNCVGNTAINPGQPDAVLQADFAYRSEHLMAVIGKQLTRAFYGQAPSYSYWFGCSTGGRQGLRIAQDFADDYDGILAGAPAIHWDRFQAYQIWPQMVMLRDTGGVMASGKLSLATDAAIHACDLKDGVVDGVIADPRQCTYNPVLDRSITKASCTSSDTSCLTPAEAGAVQKIWHGARNTKGKLLWYGLERGANLTTALAGADPFPIAVAQPKYWVYFDSTWDWHVLNYNNYENFFKQTMLKVGPLMASENPNLARFRDSGHKIITYHGWADDRIMPQGTVDYFNAVTNTLGGGYAATDQFLRLFMVPGMAHCAGGDGPNAFGQRGTTGAAAPFKPDARYDIFRALVRWVEQGVAPERIIATQYVNNSPVNGALRTRPLCPYPQVARYTGSGSTDDAANFVCAVERGRTGSRSLPVP
jgi:hypothetical protein